MPQSLELSNREVADCTPSQFELLRSERQPLVAYYTLPLHTATLAVNCASIQTSSRLRGKVCFLSRCPGLSFFSLSLVSIKKERIVHMVKGRIACNEILPSHEHHRELFKALSGDSHFHWKASHSNLPFPKIKLTFLQMTLLLS